MAGIPLLAYYILSPGRAVTLSSGRMEIRRGLLRLILTPSLPLQFALLELGCALRRLGLQLLYAHARSR
jgi:hypothetical protein